MLARAEARRARRLQAAVRIQTAYRMHVARRIFLRIRAAVLTIQSASRGKTARAQALNMRCVYVMSCHFYRRLSLQHGLDINRHKRRRIPLKVRLSSMRACSCAHTVCYACMPTTPACTT